MSALSSAASQLPSIRTCRLDPRGCDALLARLVNATCPQLAADLGDGATAIATIRARQREACGVLLSARRGSGVADAETCPAPHDMRTMCGRVVAVSAVVALLIFAAQLLPSVLSGLSAKSAESKSARGSS